MICLLAAITSDAVRVLAIVEGLDQLFIQESIQPVSVDICRRENVPPLVFLTNLELVLDAERDVSNLAD